MSANVGKIVIRKSTGKSRVPVKPVIICHIFIDVFYHAFLFKKKIFVSSSRLIKRSIIFPFFFGRRKLKRDRSNIYD